MAAVGGGVRDRDLIPGQRIQGIEQGLAVLLDRQDELPAGRAMNSAVAFTVCRASAVTILPFRSICPSTPVAIGTSFVLAPTSACAAMTEDCAGAGQRSQQMPLITLGVLGAADRLAVQPDRH